VQISRDLADALADDGFRVAGAERGAEALLGDSANLVTVLVGSQQISEFVRHLWKSAHRGKPTPETGQKVIIEHDGRRIALTLEHDGFGDDGPPQTLVAGMASLFKALSELEPRPPR
jgi:hypothetical protein